MPGWSYSSSRRTKLPGVVIFLLFLAWAFIRIAMEQRLYWQSLSTMASETRSPLDLQSTFRLALRDSTSSQSFRQKKNPQNHSLTKAPTPKSPHNNPPQLPASKWQRLEDSLLATPTSFYMYDDPRIVRPREVTYFRQHKLKHRWRAKGLAELDILQALWQHPWRVQDPAQADYFVIPLPLTALYATNASGFYEAFPAILEQSSFQKHEGHHHVLVSQLNYWFTYGLARKLQRQLRQYYPSVWNITLAKEQGSRNIQRGYERGIFSSWGPVVEQNRHNMTRSGFATGLLPVSSTERTIPASWEKFRQASLFLFYHCREREFVSNSTGIRKLLIQHYNQYNNSNSTMADPIPPKLPPSSIGHDIPYEQWAREYADSQFCLVVRGDNPQSKALLRAVQVGCIPIVVSDAYPYYAPPLEAVMSMDDYAFFISEAAYWKDPIGELLKFRALEPSVIQDKLQGLAFAQRALLPFDHPLNRSNHLFVPAFWHAVKDAKRHESSLTEYPSDFPNGFKK